METKISFHARKRIKERLGVKSQKRAEILVEKAWKFGKPIQDFALIYQSHLFGESWSGEDKAVMFFRDTIYVFGSDGTLITVLLDPTKSRNKAFSKCRRRTADE